MTLRRALLWTLLLGVLALSAWLAWLRPEDAIIPVDRHGAPLPDYYLTGVTLRQYGVDGGLSRQLKAERLDHIQGTGTDLTAPRLTLDNRDGAPWQVNAEHGVLSPDGKLLTLPDAVHISRRASLTNRPLQLQTTALRYRLEQGYAETDEAVTVTSERDRVDAVGMQAWLQDPGRIHFRSQVRGHYEP